LGELADGTIKKADAVALVEFGAATNGDVKSKEKEKDINEKKQKKSHWK
jgi:hypothetical protein